jgi:nucleotide-binding universal stress UspA family protein
VIKEEISVLPTRILLASDGSEEAIRAARSAVELSNKLGAELHVVYVGHMPYVFYESPGAWALDRDLATRMEERAEEEALTRLEEQVQRVSEAGGKIAQAHAKLGRPDAEIMRLAEQLGADLVVVGSRGLGSLRRALMGGVSDSVLHHAHASVLVVRGEPVAFPTRVLAALDGSEEASRAARAAVELTSATDSELHVVHVGEVRPVYHPERHGYLARYEDLQEEAQRLLDQQVEQIQAAAATVAQAHLRMGRPDEEIVALAEELGAGLIVTGNRGRGGLRRALMGSVSDSVVRHAHCPVLVVRKE